MSHLYRQRNGNYPANIRIDPYRRAFYFFLWSLAAAINVMSYIDATHSMFWDGVLIMFIYIIFKKFDHILLVIINPLYRKCCSKRKRNQKQKQGQQQQQVKYNNVEIRKLQRGKYYKDDVKIAVINPSDNKVESIEMSENEIQYDSKPKEKYTEKYKKANVGDELKEPLMIASDGDKNHTMMPSIEILREAKEDNGSDSDSSDSGNLYGPGSLAEGRVDEGYLGE